MSFTIRQRVPPFIPRPLARPSLDGFMSRTALEEHEADLRNCTYVMPSALTMIDEHVHLFASVASNQVEQGGLLLGKIGVDAKSGGYLSVATHAIPANTRCATGVSLSFDHQTWQDMLARAEPLIQDEIRIIGWYHTHPRKLNVFFSDIDLEMQRRMFAEEWMCAVVINPQKGCWGVYYGPQAIGGAGYWLADHSVPRALREALAAIPTNLAGVHPGPDASAMSPADSTTSQIGHTPALRWYAGGSNSQPGRYPVRKRIVLSFREGPLADREHPFTEEDIRELLGIIQRERGSRVRTSEIWFDTRRCEAIVYPLRITLLGSVSTQIKRSLVRMRFRLSRGGDRHGAH